MKQRLLYGAMATGGAVGLVASFLEVIEYQQLLQNAHAQLTCNLNSVFSCGNVLNAWQSKVFGFPNALMCMTFFTLMLAAGLVGASGGTIVPRLRLVLHALALFFLCFALWFFWQSIYAINALCILCIFCLGGLLLVNRSWLRLNLNDLPIGTKARAMLAQAIGSGADTFGWLLLAAVIALAMILHFH